MVVGTACEPTPFPQAPPGEPLPGLTGAQLTRFERGRALFDSSISASSGLGPTFNQRRCSSCHDVPSLGGGGVEFVTKVSRWNGSTCDLLIEEGGDNIQPRVTDEFAALGGSGETRPPDATHIVDLVPPMLYGLGLVEVIPEARILDGEDPDDADGDGVSGRVGRTTDGTPARFGHKATDATLQGFIEGALLQEMGITTTAHPADLTVNGRVIPDSADPAPDPEFDTARVGLLVDYVRFLAPPGDPTSSGVDDEGGGRGADIFDEVGCAGCHVPSFTTRSDAPQPLGGKIIRLYSDLLLHDLGPRSEGLCSASASPTEVRTTPLMGLRYRPLLMHDGGSTSLRAAMARHGGEAEASRAAADRLTPDDLEALLRFLRSL